MRKDEKGNIQANQPLHSERRGKSKKEKPQGKVVQRQGGHGPGGPMRIGGEKPKNFKRTMKMLLKHLQPYYLSISIVFVFAITSTVFSIQGPKIIGHATTEIFNGLMSKLGGNGGINFEKISGLMITLIILYAAGAILSFFQGLLMNKVAVKVAYNFRKELDRKISRLPFSYFDKKTHGEVLSRVTNDVDLINQTLQQSLSQMITSVTTLVGVLVMMLTINVAMTFISMIIIPLSGIAIAIVVKNSQKYFKKQQEYVGHVNGQVEEIYGAHNVMKAFNAEEKSVSEFEEYNNTLYSTAWKSQFLSGVMMPLINFIGNLGYVIVCIAGSFFAIQGKIKVGDILSFIQYVRNFSQPVSQVAQIANILQSTAAAAERVFEFLNEPEELPDAVNAVSTQGIDGAVEFENVKFGYETEKIVINNFNQKVRNGQKIAIVGPTGAGKTTIVKLLMRFYELNGGTIKIGGKNITEYKKNDLRKMIGMVLQDTWLFNGSVKENIRYGNLNATDEQVVSASKAAYVDHFVRALPGGYDMVLNEEATNISQGQKQLLTIARAILADPKILILDEATSSVDTRTEVRIQQAMENLMKGRTCFVIAHRLSTIRDADLILVMNNGDIVEQGNHQSLLDQNGFYANLYKSQFSTGLIEG